MHETLFQRTIHPDDYVGIYASRLGTNSGPSNCFLTKRLPLPSGAPNYPPI